MNVKKLHCLFPCYFLFIFYYEIVHRVQEKNEKQHKKSQSSLYAYSWTNMREMAAFWCSGRSQSGVKTFAPFWTVSGTFMGTDGRQN